MTNISGQAAQARENARSTDGKFGYQEHDRASAVLLAEPVPVDATPDDPQQVEFELDGFQTDAEAWYDEGSDTTGISVTIHPGYGQIMGIDPDVDDGLLSTGDDQELFEEASPILDRIIKERFPDSDEGGSDSPTRIFYAEKGGRRSSDEMVQAAWNDPDGTVRFANEADSGTFGHEHLSTIFRREIEKSVIPQAGSHGTPDDLDDLDARIEDYREHAEMGVPVDPPSDADARALAAMLPNEGKKIERIEQGLPARHQALQEELQYAYAAGDEAKMYAIHALSVWADDNNARTVHRWQERWNRTE
jgi:hypothetical protein